MIYSLNMMRFTIFEIIMITNFTAYLNFVIVDPFFSLTTSHSSLTNVQVILVKGVAFHLGRLVQISTSHQAVIV